jgi:hypothetical protein
MVENRGGYREPENPAPSSGPGALSQRTDGGPAQGAKYMSGMPYGQNTMEQQTAAPMSGGMPTPSAPSAPQMRRLPSLSDMTERPDEELTAGLDVGPGPGSEVMANNGVRGQTLADTIRYLAQFDPSGDAELIYRNLIDLG